MAHSKPCTRCLVDKPIEEFHRNSQRHDGRHSVCAKCRSADPYDAQWFQEVGIWRRREKKYGITRDQYESLWASQGASCAICKSRDPGRKSWSVDHDHATGKVRGILCGNCNTALGKFKDREDLLESAIRYLKRSSDG